VEETKMIRDFFDALMTKASECKYSSMNYISFEDCENAEVLANDDGLILLIDKTKSPAMLHYATDDFELLLGKIAGISVGMRIHFVPRQFAPRLAELGFKEWAEYVDFWNYDLAKMAGQLETDDVAEFLQESDCEEAAAVSHRCELQSRGFEGVSGEHLAEHLQDGGKVLIHRESSQIISFCMVSIINNGTTVWIKVLATCPAYQGRGFGQKILRQSLAYGLQNGTTKSFLATDLLNDNAIGMYKKHGFNPKESETELQMIRM